MQEKYQGYASAAFGMEGLVSAELKRMGLRKCAAENGCVLFEADAQELYLCNLRSRFSDRICILLAEQLCMDFETLFQAVLNIPWEEFFPERGAINVSCKCVRSQLMSERDCQSVAKKAVIRRLSSHTNLTSFPENGAPLPIQLSIRNNRLRILLNTSGESLSRRGYRTWNGEAPLRETLAAALVELSPWKPGMRLHDPCCGTGTILIEAALMAASRAPGLSRSFAMEKFKCFQVLPFNSFRDRCGSDVLFQPSCEITGSDINPAALELSSRHIHQAHIPDSFIRLTEMPLQDLQLNDQEGVFICNPPYGERMGDLENCRKLYRDLHQLRQRHPGWKLCAISSDPAFERFYGQRAERKRRLYNGRLECVFYSFI